jgi:isoleucyl-tRNA synthetase
VVLSTDLTDELVEEGFVREIVSKIQTMRKEAEFEVTDRISVRFKASPKLTQVIARNSAEIASDVLAQNIAESGDFSNGYAKSWLINGEEAQILVSREP